MKIFKLFKNFFSIAAYRHHQNTFIPVSYTPKYAIFSIEMNLKFKNFSSVAPIGTTEQ